MGRQEPSVRIAPKYRQTDSPDAEKILSIGGMVLDPWQSDVLSDWMAMSPAKKWVSRVCGGSVPRQNGKTGLIWGRAAAGMLLYKEQVIYTAHLQKTATETFEEMKAFFEGGKMKRYVREIRTALGREQIILRSGARVKFLARTRNGGRGQHGDLLIFDEAQELDTNAQASFVPAVSASRNPQVIYTGTPPDPTAAGTVFGEVRKKALEKKTRVTAWFEFSVKEIGDVSDKSRWADTNPALGRRILLSTIEQEFEQMDEDTFARERLGWWSPVTEQKIDYAIPEAMWNECATDQTRPEGKIAYGVKFSADGSEVCLSGAVLTKDGQIYIELIERKSTGQGTRWLAEWLNQRYSKACCVVIDGRNGCDVLIERISDVWKMKGSVIRPSARDVIASVSMLTDAVGERTLKWNELQDALNESATTSTKRTISGGSGGWGFGGENSAPIESCALAIWGVKTSKRDPGRKMLIG